LFHRRCDSGCPLRSAALAAAAGFAALAGLVASGAATHLDQWAADHAMPLAGRPSPAATTLESIVPLLDAHFHPVGVGIAQIVTLPGQVVISLVLVAAAAWRLRKRGRVEAAVCWTAAWVVAVALEIVFRHTLTRQPLYHHGVHLVGFDASWPSGHALRCALVAAALADAWPRLRIPLAIWLAAAVVLLQLAGFHTPTDVVGGLLLATAAAAGAVALERSDFLRSRAGLWLLRSGP
jgi:membrane-associated phospholipid phosphatase